jgi:drug/metabolite transporter (DMT)-like permease
MSILAFTLVIISAFLHASWNFATKRVSGDIGVLYIGLCAASLISLPAVLLFLYRDGIALSSLYFILGTGAIHAVYFFALSSAYRYGDISVVYPIARGSGVAGTAVVASMLLRENITAIGAGGIFLIVAGTILVGLRFSFQIGHYRGVLFALLVGLMIVCYSIVDKLAVRVTNPVVYIFGMFIAASLIVSPYLLKYRRYEIMRAWRDYKRYSLIIGIGAMTTYLIILFTFRFAYVSYVVAAREIAVAIGAVMGLVILREEFSLRKVIGIGAIVAGLVILRMA